MIISETEGSAYYGASKADKMPRTQKGRPRAVGSGRVDRRGRKTIKLHSGDAIAVHRTQDSRVVILEYEVHGNILSSGAPYGNRLISVITIEMRKVVHWRDYMDSLTAWSALNSSA
jgi:ketosteroid isomerase-like protein